MESKELEFLRAFDRLVLEGFEIEPRRARVLYSIEEPDERSSFELQVKYEEDVFHPEDPLDRNLAALLLAQPALNYGLFCDEIRLDLPLDAADLQFLEDAARNTATEIYCNKIHADNPFLLPEYATRPFARRKDYLRARLRVPVPAGPYRFAGPGDARRAGVLSSGGKDSLLTFGLVREMGLEAWPVFFNESGRHWYTALNAYRHFQKEVPRTGRVWCNVDRLFAFMTRHLPFIRPDFQDVRADIYPVRLWTVAILVFSCMPLLRKYGVGRILLGDEYDTSVREEKGGVAHYAGLYDQSRWFDERLTAFYAAKGLGFRQFSLLRPMSELLIEKVLAERYPDLLPHQVSCHATHPEGERMVPCGRCEKCRRILAMFLALGLDPARVGYGPESVAALPAALSKNRLHHEDELFAHLLWTLRGKGLEVAGEVAGIRAGERPEVLSLRFHPGKSPIEDIPEDLRGRWLRLVLPHARGALRWSGTAWEPFDPLADVRPPDPARPGTDVPAAAATLPAPFPAAAPVPVASTGRDLSTRFVLGEMTWPEAEQRLRESDVAILPVGSIEQHGPHLPLDTDNFDAYYLACRVAERVAPPKPLVLPPVLYGVAHHHMDFPGTISIGPDTLSRLIVDIGSSLARQGVRKLLILNAHGGNAPALHFAGQVINRDTGIFVTVDTGETSRAEMAEIFETRADVHGGEAETSTSLASRRALVRMDLAKRSIPRFASKYLDWAHQNSIEWYVATSKLSSSGVLGDPTKATEEKGRRAWEVMIRNLVELLEDLKRIPERRP